MFRENGSVQSANIPTIESSLDSLGGKLEGLYRGMIFKVHYVDDPDNVTGRSQTPQMTYDVILMCGPLEGQILTNVRNASVLGGLYNFSEIVLRRASKPFSGKGSVRFSQQDGDIVYVEFVNGDISSPVITNCGTNPLDSTSTGAKRSEGPRWIWTYNGIEQLINKNGEYILTRRGGAYDAVSDFFKPISEGNEAQIKLSKDAVTLSSDNGTIVTINGATDDVSVTTVGGVKVNIDGKNNTIDIKDSAGAGLKVSNGKVALGASSAELLDQLSKALQKLITFFNSVDSTHDHIGNLGYPSSPPETASQFTTLGSDLSSIKALVDGIKGTL